MAISTEKIIGPKGYIVIQFDGGEPTIESLNYLIKYAKLRIKFLKRKELKNHVPVNRACETALGQQPERTQVL